MVSILLPLKSHLDNGFKTHFYLLILTLLNSHLHSGFGPFVFNPHEMDVTGKEKVTSYAHVESVIVAGGAWRNQWQKKNGMFCLWNEQEKGVQ
ncbi:hypothetical protein SESBI_39566 [Sesbania bispinosa]|nr:hypothetical protein SESBI_39566 [Sesbania bispinosa]